MLTSEGHTVVDAVHIIPFSESKNDHPTNGMALCKICHWSFDKGLMFRPAETRFWPAQESFDWHRKKRFKGRG